MGPGGLSTGDLEWTRDRTAAAAPPLSHGHMALGLFRLFGRALVHGKGSCIRVTRVLRAGWLLGACLRPRPSSPAALPGCKRPCLHTWPDLGPGCGRPKRTSPPGFQETPLGFVSLERGCARRTRGDFAASRASAGWLARARAGR
jgi:hypothetical protein